MIVWWQSDGVSIPIDPFSGSWAVDTETNGFSPFRVGAKLWSIQVRGEQGQTILFVNDTNGPWAECVRDWMWECTQAICHNAKFDYLWLNTILGVPIPELKCTALQSKLLNAGLHHMGNDLASCVRRYFNVELSKDERKAFYTPGFTNSKEEWDALGLLNYASDDVKYLHALNAKQVWDLKAKGIWKVYDDIERPFLEKCLLPSECWGITVDTSRLKALNEELERHEFDLYTSLLRDLDPAYQSVAVPQYHSNLASYNLWEQQWTIVKAQTSKRKVNGVDVSGENKAQREKWLEDHPRVKKPHAPSEINIDSPSQLLIALNALGCEITSTAKLVLEELKIPLVENLLHYRELNKLRQFCAMPEEHVGVDGAIHCSYNQIVSTGRMSCSDPNLQQIPARTEVGRRIRECFVPRTGKKFVVADFAGIELVIVAALSGEKLLLDAINEGKDVHCLTMALMLGNPDLYSVLVELKGGGSATSDFLAAQSQFMTICHIPRLVEERDNPVHWVKLLRDYIKTLTYGLAYGLGSKGLSLRLRIDKDAARTLIEIFHTAYPRIRPFLESKGDGALNTLEARTRMGRPRYFSRVPPLTPEYIEKVWDELGKEDVGYEEALQEARARRRSMLANIQRQGANHCIQGLSADMTKMSGVLFAQRCEYPILLFVHDELVVECAEVDAAHAAKVLSESMKEAGEYLLHGLGVRVDVDAKVVDKWEK